MPEIDTSSGSFIVGVTLGAVLYFSITLGIDVWLLESLFRSSRWERAKKEGALFLMLPVGCVLLGFVWPLTLTGIFCRRYLCANDQTCCGINCATCWSSNLERLRAEPKAAPRPGSDGAIDTPPPYAANMELPERT
ncbi:hypothetical protein B0T14DRAFT_531310 [Immersiella caudata]|uniref:Transmembrane protein n=1 Tax=Immersiella caudata TaxID=314043 RepID=A0AA39TLQ9_9PEZI|nr:hypothetical protein B0T14DRAFT_531310 [Immersiella caudata]